ncbi:lycopene cyclase [Pacificimonas flava]|uniref:Lycopene cyclase n=2 Tax=Pacificimonas TaxID=1960290 RepID=A0A219B0V2_9SPHN|nr:MULTISPECIES: lycopene beta-cyclase CrtY [Pacificimonas]MBZ6379769.1 lycopene beta-cyclase CrtY [Pacificimonas aurantium]OWV31776.1 lycopene cyclase [Pacificimonas flava]
MHDFDILLAGGGLAAGLIALRLADTRPNLSVGIVEGGSPLGGDKIWSSFATDVRGPQAMWTRELQDHRWEGGYKVRFPAYAREVSTPYASVRSASLDSAVRARLPAEAVMTDTQIDKLTPTLVRLADGRVLEARAVIDCRGHESSRHLKLAYQKFLGVEIECRVPHGRTKPVIMDASVPQIGGYRFVYVLPFSETRLLVEDTYYADGPELHEAEVMGRIDDYIAGMDIGAFERVRTESGILPIALDGDIEAFWNDEPAPVPRAGMAAALFHPVTGYSWPDAVDVADMVKSQPRLDARALYRTLRDHSVERWNERGFYRLLNRMMFEAASPAERYRTLQHFYALDEGVVERFYAARSTAGDKARILSGRPPVPVGKALGVLAKSIPSIRWRPRWRAKG